MLRTNSPVSLPTVAEARQMLMRWNDPAPHEEYLELIAFSEPTDGFVHLPSGLTLAASREAVMHVCKNPEIFSSAVGYGTGGKQEVGMQLIPIHIDPPNHVKYRRVLDPIFAPKRMDVLEDALVAWVTRFIDRFYDKGSCDFHDEFAVPFPCSVFVELMGLPHEDLETLVRFKDEIFNPDPSDRAGAMARTTAEVREYFREVIVDHEASQNDDVITHLLHADVEGQRLTHDEIIGICYLFIVAGLDTVTDTLTTSFRFLAENPAHRQQIVDDPGIIPGAVEELLRWTSVVTALSRTVVRETELGGKTLRPGDVVLWAPGIANVDLAEYPDALEVRFDREVNRHIAFGGGIHRCVGSHLARRELRIALRAWHARIPEYSISPECEPKYEVGTLRNVTDMVLEWPTGTASSAPLAQVATA